MILAAENWNWNLARFGVNDGVILPHDIRGRVVLGPRRSKVMSQHMFLHRSAAMANTCITCICPGACVNE